MVYHLKVPSGSMIMQIKDVMRVAYPRGWLIAWLMGLVASSSWANRCSWTDPYYDGQIADDYQHLEESSGVMQQVLGVLPENPWRTMAQRCDSFVERVRQGRYPNQLLAQKLIECAAQFRIPVENNGHLAQISFNEALARLHDSATKITIKRLESALKVESIWFAKVGEAYTSVQLTIAIFELMQDAEPNNRLINDTLNNLRRSTGKLNYDEQLALMSGHCYRQAVGGTEKTALTGLRDASLAIVWPNGNREDVDVNEITPDPRELPDLTQPITVSGQLDSLGIVYTDLANRRRHVVYDSTAERYVFEKAL